MTAENFTDIVLAYENKVATITINRPETYNSIRLQTYKELIEAFQQADDSSECNIIVLTGEGVNFSSGNDLADLQGDDHQQLMQYVGDIFKTVAGVKKVIVAVVDGVAVGIGTTILLHCDIVVASHRAKFRLPFANLGVSPEGAASVLLPGAVGLKNAKELLLTGRFFSAEEAKEWGLLNGVTEPENLKVMADNYISQLTAQSIDSLVATKFLMKSSLPEVDKIVDEELRVFGSLLQSEKTQKRIRSLVSR